MKTQPTILSTYTVDGADAGATHILICGRRGWYQIQWHGVQRPSTVAQSSEYTTLRAALKALREQANLCGVKLKNI